MSIQSKMDTGQNAQMHLKVGTSPIPEGPFGCEAAHMFWYRNIKIVLFSYTVPYAVLWLPRSPFILISMSWANVKKNFGIVLKCSMDF